MNEPRLLAVVLVTRDTTVHTVYTVIALSTLERLGCLDVSRRRGPLYRLASSRRVVLREADYRGVRADKLFDNTFSITGSVPFISRNFPSLFLPSPSLRKRSYGGEGARRPPVLSPVERNAIGHRSTERSRVSNRDFLGILPASYPLSISSARPPS